MTTTATATDNHAQQQAAAQLESIVEMVRALEQETAIEDHVKEMAIENVKAALVENGVDIEDASDDDCREYLVEQMTAGNIELPDFEWDEEQAKQTIQEDPLSIQIRDGWRTPGEESSPEEFEILLCTGGPAVRIIGDLNRHCEPEAPRLQYQDWGTPWTDYIIMDHEQQEALNTYCQQFYFGE